MRTNTALSILRSVADCDVVAEPNGPWHTNYIAYFPNGKFITFCDRNNGNSEFDGRWRVRLGNTAQSYDTLAEAIASAGYRSTHARVNGRTYDVVVRYRLAGSYRVRRVVTLSVDGYDLSSACPTLLSLLEGCLEDNTTFCALHDYLEENGLFPPAPGERDSTQFLRVDDDTFRYRGYTIHKARGYGWTIDGVDHVNFGHVIAFGDYIDELVDGAVCA